LIDYAGDNTIKIDYSQFPNNASSLVKKIKTVIPNFKAGYGIIINVGRSSKDNTSIITIFRKTTTTIDRNIISEDNYKSSTAGGSVPPEPVFSKSIKDDLHDIDTSHFNSVDSNTDQIANLANNLDDEVIEAVNYNSNNFVKYRCNALLHDSKNS